MKIGINTSPFTNARSQQHVVRGSGFYIKHLVEALKKKFSEHEFISFCTEKELPGDTDLVHYPFFELFFLTLPLKKKFKTVVTVHDVTPLVFPEHFPSGIKGSIKLQLQKIAIKNTRIITDSEASKEDIKKYLGTGNNAIDVVYLAADEQFRKLSISRDKRLSLQKKYNLPDRFALYVGDATWNKNLPRLIEAAQKTKTPLVMVGKALASTHVDQGNPWNKELLTAQTLALSSQYVLVLGFVPDEDLPLLYNTATIFTMPSLYEGFGLPVLEAMQCGTPVLTTHEGSLKEVAADAAVIVDGYDTESIAAGISKLFNDKKLLQECSEKGLHHAAQFSWEKTAKETLTVYEKLIAD